MMHRARPGTDEHTTTTRSLSLSRLGLFVTAFILLVGVAGLRANAENIIVLPIERDGQVQVSFDLSEGFTSDVHDAIQSGLPTTFSYAVELRRGAAAWFDVTLAEVAVSATVRFDNLTRRYEMSRMFNGRVEETQPTEDGQAVRRWMTHFERIPLSTTAALEANGEYYVRVRAHTRPRNTWVFWPWGGSSALGHAKFTLIQ